jgi:hypothetical protein
MPLFLGSAVEVLDQFLAWLANVDVLHLDEGAKVGQAMPTFWSSTWTKECQKVPTHVMS